MHFASLRLCTLPIKVIELTFIFIHFWSKSKCCFQLSILLLANYISIVVRLGTILGTVLLMLFLLDGDILLMNEEQMSMLILLALSSAFNIVDHEVLLKYLWLMGRLNSASFKWINPVSEPSWRILLHVSSKQSSAKSHISIFRMDKNRLFI